MIKSNHDNNNHDYLGVSTADKVAYLSDIRSYRFRASHVYVRETHMSWVFIIHSTVYKMKKPLAGDLFDYRTLQARRDNCKTEFRLNNRLAPGVYKDVVPLTKSNKGTLRIGGSGRPVEWLVKMKKLPEHEMLDYLLLHGGCTSKQLTAAAKVLAHFYATARKERISAAAYIRKLQKEVVDTYNKLCATEFHFETDILNSARDGLLSFLKNYAGLVRKRAIEGRVIDAHGDLRPEHICLKRRPVIIDRLEFSKELRTMDIAEELAYLFMECEMLGDKKCGNIFIAEYQKASGDELAGELLDFYKARKAFIRSYLVARHVLDHQYSKDKRWLRKGRAYLKLCASYLKKIA